jgi:hypothetical protein
MKTIFDKKTNLVISVEDDFIENELFGTTELLCIDNFILTKFNTNSNEFYEGATPEEIVEINTPIYRKAIYDLVDKLSESAKERALGKVGDNLNKEQLEKLEKRYLVKKQVAFDIVNGTPHQNPIMADLIDFEQENDFAGEKLLQTIEFLNSTYNASIPTDTSRLIMYCNLILEKYQIGRVADNLFTDLIEYFRSKMITWLDNGQFDKIDCGKAIVLSITSNDTINDIMNYKNQFDAL